MQSTKSLKLGILTLLLVALTIFSGCGGTAPPINHYGTARGFVKDAVTKTGIEEAIVTIDSKSNITDSNGAYLIENIPAGSQSIVVTALGYQDYNNSVTIEEGDNVIDDVLLEPGATHYEDTSNSDGIATFTLQDSRVVQTKVIDVVTGEPISNIDSYLVTDGTDVAFLFIDPAGIYIPRIAPEEQSLRALARPPEERQIGTIKELWKVGETLFSGYQPKYADQIENHLASYIFRTFFIFCFPSTLGDLETSLWEFLGESGLDLGVGVAITAVIPGANLALLVVAGVEFGNTMAYELWVEHYTSRGYSLEQNFEVWRINPLFLVVPTLVPFVFPIGEPSNLVVEENPGSISGKVLDARTSLGIPNAQVQIVDLDLSNTTSSDGSYSFSSIPPGTYGIVAYKIGYNPSAQVNVRVFSGQETAALSIVLSSIVASNHAPVITSTPVTSATVEQAYTDTQPYTYNVNATDPDGDTLTYSLTTKPTGMTINSTTGLINWTPTTSTGDYNVTVKVSDGELTATQSFTITVSLSNHDPIIFSTPDTAAKVGVEYTYQIAATDPDEEDTLTYTLSAKPDGMVINESTGLVSWVPSEAQVGGHEVLIEVSDGKLSIYQNFIITVEEAFLDSIVEFEDYNLEQAVREAIDKPEGPLYLSDVIGIRTLDAERRGIESLKGIQHLQNLEWLWFSENQVSDISALKNLTKLEVLYFNENQVTDISALENLTNLEVLGFWGNQVTDIPALKNLTNLGFLDSGHNQVADISALKNLTNLEVLNIPENQVTDISPLENLTNLFDLAFEYNQVTDISALVKNEGFGLSDLITMYYNYLDLTEGSQNMQDIETLISRGVGVYYEPQRNP